MSINNSAIRWDEQGLPHSVIFNDKYFCTEDGYEEILYVSCHGNALRDRFLNLDPQAQGVFTIIETGFGTGLNFCCAWQLWQECAPATWTLHFISIELYPLSLDELNRALGLWPLLASYKEALFTQYQALPVGEISHLFFDDQKIHLSIIFDDVLIGLKKIKDQGIAPQMADAWFLSGFAPSKNPLMWTDEVFEGMALLSKKGTSLSTFTVAGFVRRGLESKGFKVQKIPGHGTKKNMLSGVFKGV